MNTMNLTINPLPAFTYRWLHMNEAHVADARAEESLRLDQEIPASVTELPPDPSFREIPTGAGPELDRLLQAANVRPLHFLAGPCSEKLPEVLRLNYVCGSGNAGAACALQLTLPEESRLIAVMDLTSSEDAEGFAALQTRIRAGKNARLDLVQLIRPGKRVVLINDIGADCGEGAELCVHHLFLGGREVYAGCLAELHGDDSSLTVRAGYDLDGDRKLDMNYIANQTGRRTKSDMEAAGVLRDRAFKLFRGTIDFKKGCAGSTGDEMEDVLMMDDTVVNQTIPLILCAEEDVAGNHGATIGRPEESALFYAQSRGMSEEAVYEMLARAKIDRIIHQIPDAKTRHNLYVALKEEEPQ